MKRTISIRMRLLGLLSAATVVLWIVAVTRSYYAARHELSELFDAQLAESADVMLRQAKHDLRESDDREVPREPSLSHGIEHRYAQQLHFQIRDAGGRLVYRSSDDLPSQPLAPGITNGYADATLHGVRWRVAVLTDAESGLRIELCQRYDAREGVGRAIARNMFSPLAAAVPLLALLIWVSTTSGIRPLGRFSAELQTRTPDDLSPISRDGLPGELDPIAAELNELLQRLRGRLDTERQFTADAAHELRTPLAAVRTQAQVAIGARNEEERSHALGQIIRGTDRMTHLVSQLLTLARVDPDEAAQERERVDLADLAREITDALRPAATSRDIALSCTAIGGAAIVSGNRTLLATLLRNLVENAIRYGRPGGRAHVVIDREADEVIINVIDDGPGIAADERPRVFDRFYRGSTSRESGSGLGLSIVKRIAELHGGSVALSDAEGGGLHVAIRLAALR